MEHLSQFLMHHWQLSIAFIVILFLIFINELWSQKKKAAALTPQMAIEKINNEHAVVIDLRDKEAFSKGHIIDSINCNSEDFNLPKMTKYKNKPIILVCARGINSQTVADKIRTQGYQPFVLSGGISAWQGTDLPLVKSKN